MAEGLMGGGSESQRGLRTTVTHMQRLLAPRSQTGHLHCIVTQHLAQGRPSVNSCGEKRDFDFQLNFLLGFPEPLVPCLQNGVVVTLVLPISADCHGEQMKG